MFKNNIGNGIIIVIFVFIFGYCAIIQSKYNSLQQDYYDLNVSKDVQINALLEESDERVIQITKLEKEVERLSGEIDSLNNVKQTIVKREFKISKDMSEGVNLLKNNLSCVGF